MQRMWRRMFAAMAGVLAVASLASAQSPPPNYLPRIPTAPGYGPVVPVSGNVRAPGGVHAAPAVPVGYYGPGSNNGCGSWKSDAGFIFGSCKSFFNPCGPEPCNGHSGHGGLGLFHKQKCPPHPFGAPYGTGYNGCAYDSYLNH